METEEKILTPNDQSRENFKNLNLTYDDLNIYKINRLIYILNDELEMFSKEKGFSMVIERPKKKHFKFKNTGELISVYIKVESHYFKDREAISFNENGWIGFAGWADSTNTKPFTTAFNKWLKTFK